MNGYYLAAYFSLKKSQKFQNILAVIRPDGNYQLLVCYSFYELAQYILPLYHSPEKVPEFKQFWNIRDSGLTIENLQKIYAKEPNPSTVT